MRNRYHLLSIILLSAILTGCNDNTSTTQNTSASQGSTSKDSVNLAWSIPTTRIDGSYLPLDELAGYRIYMGTKANDLHQLVDLKDETITQYTVDNLSSGDYYFAISAFDSDGLESGLSQVIVKQAS